MRYLLVFGLVLSMCVACSSSQDNPGTSVDPSIDIALSNLLQPRDATADLVGQRVYTVAGGDGAWSLLSAPLDGGAPLELASLIDPRNLVLADDGGTIYVVDRGGVYEVPTSGDVPMVVPGTAGYQAEGLDYEEFSGVGVLVFTGQDPSGLVGLFRVPASGGEVEVIVSGAPLVAPAGVDVDQDSVWFADASAGAQNTGAVFVYDTEGLRRVVEGFAPGDPMGLALSSDGALALVSALDDSGHSMAVVVDTATGEAAFFNDVIGANQNSGGLHRAGSGSRGDVFVWSNAAGSDIEPGGGTVYVLRDLPQNTTTLPVLILN